MNSKVNKLAILGGEPIRDLNFTPRLPMQDAEKQAALKVLDQQVLSGFLAAPGQYFNGGKYLKEFESEWCKAYGFKHAIGVNSWTSGLMAIIGAIGIEPGDEVICPPYTMSASATCVMFYGGIPVFADIETDSFCIDPVSIEEKITPRTKAIMVVHLFGGTADMDRILEIANKHDLKVIEDAAQAPGVYYKGRAVGAIGDIGGFSMNFHKHIHTGEGGIIVTNNEDLALRSQLIRNHGENYVDHYPDISIENTIGANYRMTELTAAIGSAQFNRLTGHTDHRDSLAKYLIKRLEPIEGLITPMIREDCTHAWYLFALRDDENKMGMPRSLFVEAVNAELPKPDSSSSIPMSEGYLRPLYLSRVYQEKIAIGSKGFPFNFNDGVEYNYEKGLCPVTEKLYEKELILSCLVREPLSTEDIDDFVDAIEKVASNSVELMNALCAEYSDRPVQDTVDVASKT